MEWLSALAVLVGFAGLVAAVVTLVSPRSAYLSSRWYSIPLALTIFGTLGLTMLAAPELAADEDAASTRIGGAFVFALWGMIAFGCHRLAQRRKVVAADHPSPINPASVPEPVEAGQRAASGKPATVPVTDRVRISDVAEPARTAATKSPRGSGASRSRLKKLPGAPKRRVGTDAQFIYVDADGVVTERHLTNWTIAAGYIEGFCLERRQVRTFRLDRVDEWISAE